MILRKSSRVPYAEGAFVDFHILSKCLNGTETITYMTIDTILPPTLTIKPEVNHIVYRSKIHYDMLSSLQANCAATETKPSQTATPHHAVRSSSQAIVHKTGTIRCICYDNNSSIIYKNINQDHPVDTPRPLELSRRNSRQNSPCHSNGKAIQTS